MTALEAPKIGPLSGRKIAFVIPQAIEGSGGIGEIFNRARAMGRAGAKIDFYYKDSSGKSDLEALSETVACYGDHDFSVYASPRLQKYYDTLIATAWDSVDTVVGHANVPRKFYLVQDYEAMFNAMSDGYLLGEMSYAKGLRPITLGNWLAWKIRQEFGVNSYVMPWAADHGFYNVETPVERENAVCFVYQPEKPRRCHLIALEALRQVKLASPSTKIYIFGSKVPPDVQFEFEFLGLINKTRLRELYQRCTLGLVISATNPSRIPYEMMCCGLPVVDIYKQNNLFDYPSGTVLLSYPSSASLSESMLSLLNDESEMKRRSKRGIEYMSSRPIAIEHEAVVNAIDKGSNDVEPSMAGVALEPIYLDPPFIGSVDRQPAAINFMRHQLESCGGVTPPMLHVPMVEGASQNSLAHRLVGAAELDTARVCSNNGLNAGFDVLHYYEDGRLLLHPLSGKEAVLAAISGAIPPGATEIQAVVSLSHSESKPVSFAMACTPRAAFSEGVMLPASTFNNVKWVSVKPGERKRFSIQVDDLALDRGSIVLATKMTDADGSNAFAWAMWEEILVVSRFGGEAKQEESTSSGFVSKAKKLLSI